MTQPLAQRIRDGILRAQAHEKTATRRLRVRLDLRHGDDAADCLHVSAVLAARSAEECAALSGRGHTLLTWAALDAGADIAATVDTVVADVETVVRDHRAEATQ